MDFTSWFEMKKLENPEIKDSLDKNKNYFLDLWNYANKTFNFSKLEKEVQNLKNL